MKPIKFFGVKFCTESFYIQYIYYRAKFESSSLFSLANTEGGLKAPPLPLLVLQGTKYPGLTAELCVLTELTAEFAQVA